MIVHETLDAARRAAACPTPVVTPGFFDGLHRGHQHLLDETISWADALGGTPTVVTFQPHPQHVVRGSAPPAVLSLDHRLLLLGRHGIRQTLVLRFSAETAGWTPEQFVERVLREALGARHLLLGFDSAVGHRRLGTFEYFHARRRELGIEVRRGDPLLLDGERLSSTLVRRAVLQGDLGSIERITGRPYALLGRVVTGDRRGRTLGFPTANLEIEAEAVAPGGVYFATARVVTPPGRDAAPAEERQRAQHADALPALVNIGRRPTFTGNEAGDGDVRFDPACDRVEAHLLDFEGDLYGAWLELELHARHRPEQRFSGPEQLVERIRDDERAMREWLARRS